MSLFWIPKGSLQIPPEGIVRRRWRTFDWTACASRSPIAIRFAHAGADVILLDLNADSASGVAAEVASETSGSVSALACDVSVERSVRAAFGQIAARGSLDVLVNSAGVAHIGSILTTASLDFDRLYRINVRGTYLAMQAAIPLMVKRKAGVILNMASIAATCGLSDRFAYSMTKGAVVSIWFWRLDALVSSRRPRTVCDQ